VTVESSAASNMGFTVGAIATTTDAAMALGPSLMAVFIVFGGYYVNTDNNLRHILLDPKCITGLIV
jgi:hypothetical protein